MPIALKLIEETKAIADKRKKVQPKEKEAFLVGTQASTLGEDSARLGANHRILVVDDNPVVLRAFELKLKSLGFIVTAISNAAGVASTVESQKAELIILDINFPTGSAMDWSGFTVLQWLQRFPELAQVPVIFVTGSEASKCREQALAAGAIGLFEKPVNFDELLALILEALGSVPSANDSAPGPKLNQAP